MSAHSTAVFKAFYDVCNRAYGDWRIHRILFDDMGNVRLIKTTRKPHGTKFKTDTLPIVRQKFLFLDSKLYPYPHSLLLDSVFLIA